MGGVKESEDICEMNGAPVIDLPVLVFGCVMSVCEHMLH